MSERTPSIEETEEWAAKLRKSGRTRFTFRELPAEFKNRKLLFKAAGMDLISKVSRDEHKVTTWRLN